MSELSEDYDDADVDPEESIASSASEDSAEDEEVDDTNDVAGEAANDDNFDIKSVSQYNSEINIVPAEDRQSRSVLSVSEITAIISIRAAQIQDKNNCLVDISGLTDPRKMAMRELMMRKCPLYVRRCVDGTGADSVYEIWDPNAMTFAITYNE